MRADVRRGVVLLIQAAVLGLVFLLTRAADEGSIVDNAGWVLGLIGVVLAIVALLFMAKGLAAGGRDAERDTAA